MIRALIVTGLNRMIEAVSVLVEEGTFDLIRTLRAVVVILEEVEGPRKRLERGICFRYVVDLWLVSKNELTWTTCCRCLMSFYRQQAVGVRNSGTLLRQSELHVGELKGVSALVIHCLGSLKVEVMFLVNVHRCKMMLVVMEEAVEAVHCKGL